jgi:hypothetical protein
VIAQSQRAVQDAEDRVGQARRAPLGGLEVQRAATDEVAPHAGLVGRLRELPVGRPAVAQQEPVEVGAEDDAGLGITAAIHDPIDRDRGSDEDPQPRQIPPHLPAGLVGGDDGGALDLRDEGLVGRGEGPGDAIEGLAEAAAGDGEGEGRAENGADQDL